jgi:hypothetical protein
MMAERNIAVIDRLRKRIVEEKGKLQERERNIIFAEELFVHISELKKLTATAEAELIKGEKMVQEMDTKLVALTNISATSEAAAPTERHVMLIAETESLISASQEQNERTWAQVDAQYATLFTHFTNILRDHLKAHNLAEPRVEASPDRSVVPVVPKLTIPALLEAIETRGERLKLNKSGKHTPRSL